MLLVTLSWLWAIVTMEYCFLRPGCKSFFFTRSYCEGGKQRHCVPDGNNDLSLLPHYLQMERELSYSVCFDFLKAWLVRKTTKMKWLQLQCEGGLSAEHPIAVRVQQLQCPVPAGPFAGWPSSHAAGTARQRCCFLGVPQGQHLIPVTNSYWQKTAATPQSWSNMLDICGSGNQSLL